MKYKISFLFTAVLFLVLTTSVLAASTDFYSKAKKYIDNSCYKKKISNEVSLFCYLFEKSNEQESRIIGLEQRVLELENIITASPSPSPSPSPTPLPQPFYIVSDATWKFSNVEVNGWLNANFGDSSWISAQAPSMGQCGSGSVSGGISDNGVINMSVANPNWASGFGYFRKTFVLNSIPTSSSARIIYDDDGDLYVNGNLVISDHDGVTPGIHQAVVSTSYFVVGANVVNAVVQDTNGGCQWAQVELTIN